MDERYKQVIRSWGRVNAVQESEKARADLQEVLDAFDSVYAYVKTRPDHAPPTSGLVEQQKYFQQLYRERLG